MATTTNTKTTREFITIDGEKTLLTNALMMEFAIKALEETEADEVIIAKAKAHLATISRKPTTSNTASTAKIQNEKLAVKLLSIMPDADPVTLEWVAGKLNLVGTDGKGNKQKAYQVMKVLLNLHKVEKIDGRPVSYQRI